MKIRITKIWKWITDNLIMFNRNIKRDIASMKTCKAVACLSFVVSLVFVLTMICFSQKNFASNDYEYIESDYLYRWDVSASGDGSVYAYYLDGLKNKDDLDTHREYDGELVFKAVTPGSSMIAFDGGFDRTTYADWASENGDAWDNDYFTDSNYYSDLANTILNNERGFANGSDAISPWGLLTYKYDDFRIHHVKVLNNIKLTDGDYLFDGIKYCLDFDILNFDFTDVTSLECAFLGCEYITELNLTNMKPDALENLNSAFDSCYRLENIEFSDDLSLINVEYLGSTFSRCESIKEINLPTISNLKYFGNCFAYCYRLKELNLSNITLSADYGLGDTMVDVFYECKSLKKIVLPHSNISEEDLEYISVCDLPNNEFNLDKWYGYKEGTKKDELTLFTFYGDDYDTVQREAATFSLNGKEFAFTDYKYAFIIGLNYSPIYALYYNGDGYITDSSYDGELIFLTLDEDDLITGKFTNAVKGFNYEFDVDYWYYISDLVKSDEDDEMWFDSLEEYQSCLDDYDFDSSNIENTEGITPWSLMNAADSNNQVKHIYVKDEFKLGSGDYFFAGLNNLESIDIDKLDLSDCDSYTDILTDCTKLKVIKLPEKLKAGVDITLPGDKPWYLYDADWNKVGNSPITKLVISGTDEAVFASNDNVFNIATSDSVVKDCLITYKEELDIDELLEGKSEDIINLISNYVYKNKPDDTGYTSNEEIKENVEFVLNHIPTLTLSSDKTEIGSGESAVLTSTLNCEDSIKDLFKENNLYKKDSTPQLIVKNGTYPYSLNYNDSINGTYYQEYILDTSITVNPYVLKSNEITINKKSTGGGSSGGGSSSGGGGGSSAPVKEEEIKVTLDEVVEHKAFINGYEDKTFKPNSPMTRAEFAKIIASINNEFKTEDYTDASKIIESFGDIRDNYWYTPYIAFVIDKKIMNGYPEGGFKPEGLITRAEVSKVLGDLYEISDIGIENNFPDVREDWYKAQVDELIRGGVIKGYDDMTFGPKRNITRAEFVALINRINKNTPDREISKEIKDEFNKKFTDIKETDWFYLDVLEASVNHKGADLHQVIFDEEEKLLNEKIEEAKKKKK